MIRFGFVFAVFSICQGFLVNNTVVSTSGGTLGGQLPMTDQHYLMLTDLLAFERQSREKLEQSLLQMEKFVIQLQGELLSTKDRVAILEMNNGAAQGNTVDYLKNDTHFLKETILQMEVDQDTQKKTIEGLQLALIKVQTDNQKLQRENVIMKEKLNMNTNLTMNVKMELDLFSHSVLAFEISNVTMLQNDMLLIEQEMGKVNFKISQLSSNALSRGQDFLALLNQSDLLHKKLTELSSELELFKNDTQNQQLALVKQDNITDANVKDAMRQIDAINQTVVLTSCALSSLTYSTDEVIQFPSTKTVYGVSNLTKFQDSGKFVCEKSGVYLFSVFIMSKSPYSEYGMFKNDSLLSYVEIVGSIPSGLDYQYHSGAGTWTVLLETGETLYVKAVRGMVVYREYSCLSVIKLK